MDSSGGRSRTYSWQDPRALAAAAATSSGLGFLTAICDGRLPTPPALVTAGIVAVEFGDGRAVFALDPAEWQYNPIGSVHDGILTTLADSALGCAVHTKLPAGTAYTSLELKINFTRAVSVYSGRLLCEGNVVAYGRRTATSEARIRDSAGRVIGHASTTCLIINQ